MHVLKDPLCILWVCAGFHNGQQQFRSIIFQLQYQVHPGFGQGIDVTQDESNDDVQTIALMRGWREEQVQQSVKKEGGRKKSTVNPDELQRKEGNHYIKEISSKYENTKKCIQKKS